MASQAYHTVVRNISGSTMFFAFLGEHGIELADGADANIPGNIFETTKDVTKRDALFDALDDDRLAIIRTPDCLIQDTSTGAVKKVKVTGGTIGVANPTYGSYTGSVAT